MICLSPVVLNKGKTACLVLLASMLLAGCAQGAESTRAPQATRTVVPSDSVTAAPTAASAVVTKTTKPVGPTSVPGTPAVTTSDETVTPAITPTPGPFAEFPGALIQISMQSQVGILLDEFPADIREDVAADLMAQTDETWLARATRQLRLSRLRLNFRNFGSEAKGQLPLPPEQLWHIRLDDTAPIRQTIQGHDVLLRSYTFSSTLLTTADSPAAAELALAEIGGVWQEAFVFPVDPDMLLQRTGNACVNEGGFPPNSFDSENIWYFFDFDCEADSGGVAGCHRTRLPEFSCRQMMAARIGEVETTMRFERLPWSAELADQVRVGELTSSDTPDLQVVADDLAVNRIIYRHFEADDCAVEEGGALDSGWRRLLQFNATVQNVGGQPLEIGEAAVQDLDNHVFIYSPCHDHFHYSYYGEFFIQDQAALLGSKQAFCVQSTSRLSNNELSPLIHDYSCRFQGIQVGWVDEYIAGLDAQWVDITDLEVPEAGAEVQLGFRSNGDRFLCEGTAVRDEDGAQLWEPSGLTDSDGHAVNRPQCDFIPDWEAGNEAVQTVFVPEVGSFVTTPCASGELGPLRNCGFTELEMDAVDSLCVPGEPVSLSLDVTAAPLIVRGCERSAALETGVACSFTDSLVNVIVSDKSDEIAFTCPLQRDGDELEGGFSIYTAPLYQRLSGETGEASLEETEEK